LAQINSVVTDYLQH